MSHCSHGLFCCDQVKFINLISPCISGTVYSQEKDGKPLKEAGEMTLLLKAVGQTASHTVFYCTCFIPACYTLTQGLPMECLRHWKPKCTKAFQLCYLVPSGNRNLVITIMQMQHISAIFAGEYNFVNFLQFPCIKQALAEIAIFQSQ